MFKNSTHLPLSKQSGPAPFDEEKFKQILADEDLMNAMRRYFLILNTFSEQTLVDFTIPSAVSEYA